MSRCTLPAARAASYFTRPFAPSVNTPAAAHGHEASRAELFRQRRGPRAQPLLVELQDAELALRLLRERRLGDDGDDLHELVELERELREDVLVGSIGPLRRRRQAEHRGGAAVRGRADARDVPHVDAAGLDVIAEEPGQVEDPVAESAKPLEPFGAARAQRLVEEERQRSAE